MRSNRVPAAWAFHGGWVGRPTPSFEERVRERFRIGRAVIADGILPAAPLSFVVEGPRGGMEVVRDRRATRRGAGRVQLQLVEGYRLGAARDADTRGTCRSGMGGDHKAAAVDADTKTGSPGRRMVQIDARKSVIDTFHKAPWPWRSEREW